MKYWLPIVIGMNFCNLQLKGQILYTDFHPDTILTTPVLDSVFYINVDINQDNVYDFSLASSSWFSQGTPMCCMMGCCNCNSINVFPLDTNSKIGWEDTMWINSPCRPLTVDSGFEINSSSLIWWHGGNLAYTCNSTYNCRQDESKLFVPVKLFHNQKYYYGWIKILHHKIYDMAINLLAEQPIYSAQKQAGISTCLNSFSITAFPNPTKDEVFINVNNGNSLTLLVYDLTGKNLIQESFTSTLTINIESLTRGIYIYEIRDGETLCKAGKVMKI